MEDEVLVSSVDLIPMNKPPVMHLTSIDPKVVGRLLIFNDALAILRDDHAKMVTAMGR